MTRYVEEIRGSSGEHGAQSGTVFTFRGKGIRSARNGTGNLIIRVIVEVPSKLSKDQKKHLEKWDDNMDMKQYDRMRRYADNVEALYGDDPYKEK